MRKSRRGSALFLALATLALVSGFALAFLASMRLEVRASSAHVDARRATLLAEAGVARSLCELAVTFEDPLENRTASWAYLDATGDFAHGTPLGLAKRASLQSGTRTLDDGATFPISGCLGGTYEDGGDVYLLKILDVSTQFDLNDGRPGLGALLDHLGRAIGEQLGRDPVRGRGAKILELRNRTGVFHSKRELVAVLGADDLRLLSDFVTVDGWRDPVARRALAPDERPSTDDLALPRFGIERRCPINVNAAPRPVLVALLAGVGTGATDPVSYEQAKRIADRILDRRKSTDPLEGPFRDIVELDEWILSLATGGSQALLTSDQAAALVANLDPNLRVHELNPDAVARFGASKYELAYRTTEATFFSHGKFEVTSLGRILARGRIVAEAHRQAVVLAYEVARHTTQIDFEMAALRSTTENCPTYPNPTRRLGGGSSSSDHGYVQLCDPEAQAGPELFSSESFAAPFTRALAGTVPAQGNRLEDVPSTEGGDLDPDGTRTQEKKRRLAYPKAPPLDEGSIDLWLKIDSDLPAVAGSVVQAVNVLSNDLIVVTDLTASSDGSTLVLELERKAYAASPDVVFPYRTGETRTQARLAGLGAFGEWHHVRIAWRQGLEARLYVDGELVPAGLRLPFAPEEPSWPPPVAPPCTDSLVVGGHDAPDGPLWRKLTVDDVVVHEAPVSLPSSFPPPERFPAQSPDYVGRYVGAFGPFPEGVEFGFLFWTERTPKQWGRVTFTQDDFSLDGYVEGGLDSLTGKPKKLKIEKPKKGKDGGKSVVESTGSQDGHANENGNGNGGNGSGGGKGNGNGGGKGKGKVGGLGGLGQAPPGGSAGINNLPPDSYLRPELQMLRGPASPDDVGVIYELRFKYTRDGLIKRGIVVPPLNVSPIIDDVTLVYRLRSKILRVETDDE